MGKQKFKQYDSHKSLTQALDAGYQHYRTDIFRWMLEAYLHQAGVPSQAEPDIPDSAGRYVQATLDAYVQAVERSEPFTDILGTVYMDCASHWGRSGMGQFFTPQNIADMMAMMMLGEDTRQPNGNGDLWRTIDPCIGSGVMMLSFSRAILRQQGADALNRWSVTGVDLDGTCSRMFAVQMLANCAFHGFTFGEIVAMQGNSLSSSPDDYRLLLHMTSPDAPPQVTAKHPSRIEAIAQAAIQSGVQPPEQLALFDLETS